MNNGNELYRLEIIKSKVLNNIKLNKQEEHLLEMIDSDTEIPIFPYDPYVQRTSLFGFNFNTPNTQFDPLYYKPFKFNMKIENIPEEKQVELVKTTNKQPEYLGVYQLIVYEESGDFCAEQILSTRWLTKDQDAETIERDFVLYAKGWSDANFRNNEYGNEQIVSLFFTRVGENFPTAINIDKQV